MLNSLEIDIRNASFFKTDSEDTSIPANNIELSSLEETATLVFSEPLPLGKSGYLYLEFVGEINDKMKGFYRSKHTR